MSIDLQSLRARARRGRRARPQPARDADDIGHLTKQNVAAGKRFWASRWHSADASFYPSRQRLFGPELEQLIRELVVRGYAPPEPLLGADDQVITLGSCFARELRTFLAEGGLLATRFKVPAGLNNTYALLDFFSWCVSGSETGRGFRYDRLEGGEIEEWAPESERQAYVDAFAEAGAFVFTIGLAEVWEDRETGGVFWRGVPEEIFDRDRHVNRLTKVDENVANLRRLTDLVRQVNPHAPIVLTLSPVPLAATFRGVSCVAADCVSKSVLRVALDELMADGRPGVYYWPSFEIVRWAGAHYDFRAYGFDDDNPRHVTRYLVAEIINSFVSIYYRADAVELMRSNRLSGRAVVPSPASLAGRLRGIRDRRARTQAGRGRRAKARDMRPA
jgi:hypothetical protein